jgi:hypothetical protein
MTRSGTTGDCPASPAYLRRHRGQALRPRGADMRFGAQQIPDLAVDFRHFVGRPQRLLQTALRDLSEPQVRPCFHQSRRLRVDGGARRTCSDSVRCGPWWIRKIARWRRHIFRQRFVTNPDFGQSLDQIEDRVHIERYNSDGWAGCFLQLQQEKCRLLAAILLQFPYFRRLLVTLAILLAFDLKQSKLFCTIKMLSDLFHSNPEGSEAIYR